jgi:3-hexulose-6-phosphate synthase
MTRPLFQLAVDATDLQVALALIAAVHPHHDIVEIGTPLLIEEGLRAVEAVKARWPDTPCLADLKIMDAGALEAGSAFRRGADVVTVLGLADDETVRGALAAAATHGGQVMADLIQVPDPARRAVELEALGVPIVCLHTAHDVQGRADPLAHLRATRAAVGCRIAIAGGLGLEEVAATVRGGADVLVFGGAIARHRDPGGLAAAIAAALREAPR